MRIKYKIFTFFVTRVSSFQLKNKSTCNFLRVLLKKGIMDKTKIKSR